MDESESMNGWPGTSERVAQWIRDSLRADDDLALMGLERSRIEVDLDGDDLRSLLIDATGLDLQVREIDLDADAPPPVPTAEPEPVSTRKGVAHSIRVLAQPLRIEGHSLTLDVQLRDVDLSWCSFDGPRQAGRPESAFDIDPDASRASGSIELRVRADELGPLVQTVLQAGLGGLDVQLSRIEVSVTTSGERLRLRASGAGRWKLVSASVRGEAELRVRPDGVVTVEKVRLGSRNLLVAAALAAVRSRILAAEGSVIDLNELLQTGEVPRIRELLIEGDQILRLSARLG